MKTRRRPDETIGGGGNDPEVKCAYCDGPVRSWLFELATDMWCCCVEHAAAYLIDIEDWTEEEARQRLQPLVARQFNVAPPVTHLRQWDPVGGDLDAEDTLLARLDGLSLEEARRAEREMVSGDYTGAKPRK